MKKLLSILGVCGLVGMSANLTACDKPNNNENGGNKPKPNKPQEPPVGSKWKLIDIHSSDWISNNEFRNNKNKWYIMFAKKRNTNNFNFIKFKNDDINKPWSLGDEGSFNISLKGEWYWFNWLYRWDGNSEPQIPTVDNKTGKITDWKE
ncbi:Spiroplasmavirus-related protein [Spiroplasma melliferum]|uniref:Spiroplasmavirus-related protein n=1 Tax=Spiroplasma melliferum TaxID=2134 RepID=A0ABX5U9Q3_SPIME|nr:lipoprotein [Spiroplasma melliferum]QCO24091.1 Spiroplasmavirus-related protein [Spiroplasma melliferum]